MLSKYGIMEGDVMAVKGWQVRGLIKRIIKGRSVSMEAKRGLRYSTGEGCLFTFGGVMPLKSSVCE